MGYDPLMCKSQLKLSAQRQSIQVSHSLMNYISDVYKSKGAEAPFVTFAILKIGSDIRAPFRAVVRMDLLEYFGDES